MSFGKEKSQKPRLSLVSSNSASSAPRTPVTPSVAAKHLAYSQVIKTEDLRKAAPDSSVRIDRFTPSEVAGKRAAVLPSAPTSHSQSRLAVDGLKQNLKALNELQARLRFMLTELEEQTQKA